LTTKKREGPRQRALGVAAGLVVAARGAPRAFRIRRLSEARGTRPTERGVEHPRLLDVRADLNASDGHEADAGIVDLTRKELAELAADLIGNPVGSGTLRHQELSEEFGLGPGDQTRLEPLDFSRDRRQLAVGVLLVRADGDDGQPRALPQILVIDLRNSDIEFLEPILDPPDDHTLLFERPGAGDMELDGKKADDHVPVRL